NRVSGRERLIDIRSPNHGVSPNRERPYAAKLHGDAVKMESTRGQLIQVAKVFDNRDSRAEQQRVRGPRPILRVVNVDRIYPDERCRGSDQKLGGAASNERSVLAVLRRAPARVPAGANQDSPVS